MTLLNGKIAIVTCAGCGTFLANAKPCAVQGAKVAFVQRTAENVDQVVADIQVAGNIALEIVCDIANLDQITATVYKLIAAYNQIDIPVNNAFDHLDGFFIGGRAIG